LTKFNKHVFHLKNIFKLARKRLRRFWSRHHQQNWGRLEIDQNNQFLLSTQSRLRPRSWQVKFTLSSCQQPEELPASGEGLKRPKYQQKSV